MTRASDKPDENTHQAASPVFEVPVVTASLSRRALRQRESIASVEPLIETRRDRRERELAELSAASSTESETSAPAPTSRRPGPIVTWPAFEKAVPMPSEAAEAAELPTPVPAAPVVVEGVVDEGIALDAAAADAPDAVSLRRVRVRTAPEPENPVAQAPKSVPPVSSVPRAAAPAARSVVPAAVAPAARSVVPATPLVAATPLAAATTVTRLTFDRLEGASEPRSASTSVSSTGKRAFPALRRKASEPRPGSRKRTAVNTVVMVATAGLVATLALPAYAYSDTYGTVTTNTSAASQLGIQSLTVSGVGIQDAPRDGYTTTGNIAAMDSTTGTTVSPTVQALAAELMADVASGKLVGSVPDHIKEIQSLANGQAVQGCGVDYRVLQTIKVAVDNFDKVGVSDINRKCTGQIEGAGTASSHYANGGGHAVDFYILNGHGLTGADSDSLKLIRLLDPLVPKNTNVGQAECGRSISLTNMNQFDDSCTHLHVDFGNATGVSLNM